ncbi:MAG: alpha/beta hydrolase family protein [Acidimicrobiales bacterium]
MHAPYAALRRNRIAWAQHWRHGDGPRPTIVVIHGFMASPYWLNGAFCSMPWFYEHGYDVLFVTLPFHGRRRSRLAYNGAGIFAHGVAHVAEAMVHAIHDLRLWISHLEGLGVERVGVTGISLGGYTTALLAAADDRPHFAIPNAPVSDMAVMGRVWPPTGQLIEAVVPRRGISAASYRQAMASHSPLSYPPRLPKDRVFIIAGLGDRLAPPSQSEALWEHWDRCQLHWYPGSHALHLSQGTYLKLMGRFMQQTGFAL